MYEAPQEFIDHVQYITTLTDQIEDDSIRVKLLDAIEALVHGMNGPWYGASVGWMWGDVPDDLASLFDEGEA